MQQDLQVFTELDTEQGTAPDTAHTPHVHRTDTAQFSPGEVMQLVGISERTVYKYSGQLIESWYWLPESAIRESGRYSEFAIQEMKRLKAVGNISRYQQQVCCANNRPLPADANAKLRSQLVKAEPVFNLTKNTKATEKVKALKGELVEIESQTDSEFQDFVALSVEIVSEEEAYDEQDELEWQVLRRKNAQKWLKRRAILERDKQQILQGDIPLPSSSKKSQSQ